MVEIPSQRPLRTVVIGSGNVATHLGPALQRSGLIDVVAVYSPNAEHASAYAARFPESPFVASSIPEIPLDADLYLVAIKDDAIQQLAKQLPRNDAVWLHTSGSIGMKSFAPLTDNYGVLYPLQTFSKDREISLSDVPFLTEASNPETLRLADELACSVSEKVYHADREQRRRIHAAAVFACNFTNYLWTTASNVLAEDENAPFGLEILEPLLKETLRKALTMGPEDAQTGPARRGDRGVMANHAELLDDSTARLYNYLSECILKYYKR